MAVSLQKKGTLQGVPAAGPHLRKGELLQSQDKWETENRVRVRLSGNKVIKKGLIESMTPCWPVLPVKPPFRASEVSKYTHKELQRCNKLGSLLDVVGEN